MKINKKRMKEEDSDITDLDSEIASLFLQIVSKL